MARFLKKRIQSQGKAPGSLTFLGRQKMEKPRLRIIQYNEEKISEFEISTIEEFTNILSENQVTWLNIDGLHDIELIKSLGLKINISNLILEDIVNTDQRPNYYESTNYISIILKFVKYNKEINSIKTDQVSLIFSKNYIITFQETQGTYFEAVRERLRNSFGRIRKKGPDYLAYALIDTIVDHYIENIEILGEVIEEMEKEIFNLQSKNTINKIYTHKTEISYLRKTIRPVKEIVNQLLKSESILIHDETSNYLKDLEDLVSQSTDAIEVYSSMISDQLNIYHANLGSRANEVMKVLTIFAAIFIPLTFIAGIYGTNFDYVPELHFKYSYFIMLGFMVVVAIIMLLFFRKKRWF